MPTPAGTSGYVGTGGGGELCLVSPSDMAGQIDNILTRLAKVEQVLSVLLGMDITAGSLDEISQNLGTMTMATLINAARGWTTEGTFSGVAISTLGWKMYNPCTGQEENFPIVITNPDGSLNFGATENGTLCGSSVEAWNTAVTGSTLLDYGLFDYQGSVYQTRGTSISLSSVSAGSLGASAEIVANINQAGLYMASGMAEQSTLGTGGGSRGVGLTWSGEPAPGNIFFQNDNAPNPTGTITKNSTSRIFYFSGNGWIRVYTDAIANWTTTSIKLNIVRLSG